MLNECLKAQQVETSVLVDEAAEKSMLGNIERFVQRLRMNAHLILIGRNRNKSKEAVEPDQSELIEETEEQELIDLKIGFTDSFDPDNDGFVLNTNDARALHCNINSLQFVRRRILWNKQKVFEQGLPILE